MTTSTAVANRPPNAPAPVTRDATAIEVLERVITTGDLSQLQPQERVALYTRTCESLGLNPLTRPFEYITLNGKLTLYARKDATDQLRRIYGVSITDLRNEFDEASGLFTVWAYGISNGRQDAADGVVNVKGLSGEALANARMKATTKAKRRLTLSLVGLGFLDESEVEGAEKVDVDATTGEVRQVAAKPSLIEAARAQQERLSTPTATAAPAAPLGNDVSDTSGAAVATTPPAAPPAAAPAAETATCGDEDASPMALGYCAKPKGHTGPHASADGSWPR